MTEIIDFFGLTSKNIVGTCHEHAIGVLRLTGDIMGHVAAEHSEMLQTFMGKSAQLIS